MIKCKRWSAEEIALLRELVTTKTFSEIGEIMGKSKETINWKATELGLKRRDFRDYT